MQQVSQLITVLLILLPLAAAARIVYCLIAMSTDHSDDGSYKRRIRNILIFLILAESIMRLIRLSAAIFRFKEGQHGRT